MGLSWVVLLQARPIGSKAAKDLKKESLATGKNVEKMRKEFHRLVDSALRKEAFDELTSLYKMYRVMGDLESARSVQSEIQETWCLPTR